MPVSDGGGGGQPSGSTSAAGGEALGGGGSGEHPAPWAEDKSYTGIYAGLDDVTGDALVTALCGLVTTDYASVGYAEARQLVFGHVDDHDGQVLGVYDGLWHDPADPDINIEHTWPQSKGADTTPAKSDMHHLFPVRADFNSARGNLPFGEVVSRDWPPALEGDAACADAMPSSEDGCFSFKGQDASGVTVFEPRDGHKGDVARAIFYFSIRYGEGCKVRSLAVLDPTHPSVSEAVLKAWNLHDPPSDHERTRNDRVEHEEGVRNPFIDHPELVDRIAFQ